MSDIVYSGLTVDVRRNVNNGTYELGTWCDGAFIVWSATKLGKLDADVQEAKDAADHAAAQQPPAPVVSPSGSPSPQDTAVQPPPQG